MPLEIGERATEIEIELVNTSQGAKTYYMATLSNVHLAKVTSRSVWGSNFDELQLEPDTIHLSQKRQTPQGTWEPSGQTTETCTSSRVP